MKTASRSGHTWLSAWLLFAVASVALAAADAPIATSPWIEELMTTRDGVKLAADVYRPKGDGPWPVVLMRTPYLKEQLRSGERLQHYLRAEYVVVVQDVRGKGRSEGLYRPFFDDRQDGYDTVEWAAKRPWSNGRVGMTGRSALGITANLAATTAPPSLVAIYTQVAPHLRFEEATFMGGVFKEADNGGWMRRQGAGDQVEPLKRRVVWDAIWEEREVGSNLHNVRVPAFNSGGWYDIFNLGNIRNFMYLQQFGAPGAKGRQKLVMGPYGHGELSGALAYPSYDARGAARDEIRWFDYWLKGVDNGVMTEPPVRYFMMAGARKDQPSPANGWRTADSWPPPHLPTRYYLQPDKRLSPTPPPQADIAVQYVADPAKPIPTVGGANLTFERGPMDQRKIGERADYLRFETPPLAQATEIAGPVTAELWVTTDGPDTDFMAKLVDVYPDGYEAIVLDAPLRARYRNGRRAQDVSFMTPGQPTRIVIELWHTALRFEPGHKIALHISSSNSPRFDVNDNAGTPPGEPPKPRVAKNSVHADAAHPSALVLPVLIE